MGFWSDAGFINNTKRSYRWICQLGISGAYAEWMVKSVSKPGFSISETSHRFINHTFWYPGRVEWDAIDITLVDPVTPDGAMTTMHLIESAGYDVPNGVREKWKTISKATAVNALGAVIIRQLDENGNNIEVWDLKNPWIKGVKFGDLSYDSDDISTINLSIRYDWASLWTKNTAGRSTEVGPSAPFPSTYELSWGKKAR
jgi:hypothetical protein